jgi:neutral ceramidase
MSVLPVLQVIVFVPGEFTTMAGRRLRMAVRAVLAPAWGPDIKVTLTSLTNTYSSYTTTYEEYQIQRYEGGSTLYGPYTLDAYIQASVHLAKALVAGQPVQSTVSPESEHKLLSLLPPVMLDTVPPLHKFGDVIRQPRSDSPYHPGDVAEAVFWSANPRNNLRRGGTFLEIQFLDPLNGQWVIVHTDDDWSTKYMWDRPKGQMSSESTATVQWQIPDWTRAGTYRIKMYGDAKIGLGHLVKSFEGLSQTFTVAGVPAR